MNGTEVKLTLPQVQRYEVCKALLEGRLTTAEAALALGLSPRQVQRLQARLQADGPPSLVHGNTARPPANKTPDQLKQQVLDLATTTYATEATTDPSGFTYDPPSAIAGLAELEELTTTSPPVNFRRQTGPTAEAPPSGAPTSTRQLGAAGSAPHPVEKVKALRRPPAKSKKLARA